MNRSFLYTQSTACLVSGTCLEDELLLLLDDEELDDEELDDDELELELELDELELEEEEEEEELDEEELQMCGCGMQLRIHPTCIHFSPCCCHMQASMAQSRQDYT
jgi:hypothetical protein